MQAVVRACVATEKVIALLLRDEDHADMAWEVIRVLRS
jgi:hypothetical protein